MTDNSTKILSMIRKGRLDGDLDEIAEALHARRKRVDLLRFAELQVGQAVQVNEVVKPKYMAGAVGVVCEKRQSKVTVEFPTSMGRFGRKVVCPMSILKVVTA